MAAKPKPPTTVTIQLPDACPPDFLDAAIAALPPEITKVIAVDFGVDRPTPAVVEQIEASLDHYRLCQPFSRITYMDAAGEHLGSMSSAAKGYSLNDKRWSNPSHYCQRGIIGIRIDPAWKLEIAMIPGEIFSPVPTPYVPPVIEPVEFIEATPVYAEQDPSEIYSDPVRVLPEESAPPASTELYTDTVRILPEELASLDTDPKP
jgi:hypothetical protein